jgi:hypothetical protein
MQRQKLKMLFFTFPCVLMSSCSTTQVITNPKEITLQDAMKSIGEGFVALADSEGPIKTGLIASEVTVIFNISATATNSSKLNLEIGSPQNSPVTAKASDEMSSTATGSRGNQITIKFVNLFKDKTAEEFSKLAKVFSENDIHYWNFQQEDCEIK